MSELNGCSNILLGLLRSSPKTPYWQIVLKCCLIFFFQINQSGHDRELSLDVDQFCEILSIVLNKGSREEYEDLFNKIDVGKEGYADWDKFCSHMLLEYYEKDDRMKTTQVINTQGFLNGIYNRSTALNKSLK